MDILQRILEHKREEIGSLRKKFSPQSFADLAAEQSPPRGFATTLRKRAASGAAVIAEIKKASPSRGLIRTDFDPPALAQDYEAGGAACLSVLTDERFFLGASAHLKAARAAVALPVIRKDFILDTLQVQEARALGADAILLIAAALSSAQMNELAGAAGESGLDVLVEIHERTELDSVLRARMTVPVLLGINNRNLRTFETSLSVTRDLLPHCPPGAEVVTESGIATSADVQQMLGAGVRRFLVGESLMRAESPGAALKVLLG